MTIEQFGSPYVDVDEQLIVLDHGQRLRLTPRGVVQFSSPNVEHPVCLGKYDLAELYRMSCGGSLVEAVKCLVFVIEHGHRFSETPWVPIVVDLNDEEPF